MRSSILCGGFKRSHGMEKQHKSAAAVESAEPHLVPGLESLCSQDFIHFKSRKLIYNQLLEALERNYMTGLHGIGGVGKTTLAKQVCLKLHESIKFDHVIFITVSKCSNIKEIQDIIAAKLGLSWEGKNEWERTETIMKRLMNGERIMLILDDVWDYINTEEIGIPSIPNNMMNCRVLVTSRDKQLCISVGCRRSIQLEDLPGREKWMLFNKHAGINDNSSQELHDLRKQFTEAFPLLHHIVAFASILKGRSLQEWENTLSYFKEYSFHDEIRIKAYAFLKFSHDDLNIDKAQRLSILLSMFPLNTEVPIEMLTRLGIGVGLFHEVEKYSEARSEVLKLKDILLDSHVCFEDEGGQVKMNYPFWYMIRDGVLSLCKIDNSYIDKWVSSTIENNIHYLYYDNLQVDKMDLDLIRWRYAFDDFKVEMLLINVEASNSVEVLDALFKKMSRLQVLSLSSKNLHPTLALKLPSSLQSLTNIHSLLLSRWKLGDISILGKLQSLDTLDFDNCSVYEFPKEISTLKLRLLSLKRCQIETNNPLEVIERCFSLQELYYKDNEVSTHDSVNEAEEIYPSGTFLALNRYYLQGGKDSISKCVCLPSIDALVSEATFKYLIQGAEILHLKEIRGEWRNLIPEIVSSMNDVVELSLESCSKVECLVNTQHNGSHLVSAFSKLEELKLARMDNLKELWSGDHPSYFLESLKKLSIECCPHLQGILFKSNVNLCKLKSVNVYDCQELTSLFQLSTALCLVLLEELIIRDCKLLTDIIEDENDLKSNGSIFPKLETLEIEGCERLECIPRDVMLLQNIKISKCPKLKHIFHEEQGDIKISRLQKVELSDFKAKKQDPNKDRRHKLKSASKTKFPVEGGLTEGPMSSISSSECPPKQSQGFNMLVVHNIKQLVLKDLDKIKYLFTLSSASSMILEILIIDSCHELKHIIDIGDSPGRKNFEVVFLKLKELSVSTCCQLECMFGEYLLDDQNYNEIHIHLPALKKLTLQELPEFSLSSMTWTSLKEFVLVQCPNFIINPISDMMIHFDSRKLVSKTIEDIKEMDKHFLTLETLNIKGYEAESIFCLSGFQIIGQLRLGLQCLKLSNLPRMSSICVGSRSSFMFPNLKTIQLIRCLRIEVIFPASVLSYLPELEVLEIQDCGRLKQIIEEDKKLGNVDSPQPCFPKLAVLVVKECNNLKRLIPASDVPNVKTIRIVDCDDLEVIFPRSVLSCLPELEVLEIEGCRDLEQIIEEEDKKSGNVDSPQPCFPKLTELLVKKCRNLKHVIPASDIPNVKTIRIVGCDDLEVIFPRSVLSCLPELEVLEIEECMNLKQIIEEDKKLGNVDSPQPCFPNLAVLLVKEGRNLKHVIPASDIPNVKTIRIVDCHNLEVIFPRSVLSCLPKLERLEIQECRRLEKIIEEDKKLGNVDSRQPCFPNLAVLVVRECLNLTRLFSAPNDVPNLELLIIIKANKLEELMGGGEQRQGDDVSIGNMKVLIFIELPEATFKEGIELQTAHHRFVHKCPKLCLKATVTFKKIEDKVLELFRIDLQKLLYQGEYNDMLQSDDIVQSDVAQTVSGSDLHSSQISEESEEESQISEESEEEVFGEVFDSKILARTTTSTSLTEVQGIESPSSSHLDIPTHLHEELVDEQSISEPYLMNQQKPLNDTESTIDIPQSEIRLNQSETYTDKENEGHAMNIQDFKDDDLISLFQSVEEDGDGQIPLPSVSVITEDNLVVDVLAELEKSLKMPLKDIASSEANTLHFLNALHFLSHLPLEDETLSDGLKAIIESLHQEFLNILHSFKKAFATINNFAMLEEKEKSIKEELARQNGIAITLVSKISKAKNYMEEAQQKKAILKEQIIDLEKEIQDLHEMVDGRSMSESCLINQQKSLAETEITIEIPQCLEEKKDQSTREGSEIENTIIKRRVEEGTTSNNAKVETSLTHAESTSSKFGTLVTSHPKPNPHSEIELKHVFADLEESLKMPLNDIASSEGNNLHFLKALNFLSHLPLEDITLSDGCKAIIDSLRHEFPSILSSFEQAFAITNKFAVLGSRLNEVTTMLVSKKIKAKNFMGESQQKEATLKEEIIRLEKATTDVPVGTKTQTNSGIDLPSSQINEESKMELVGKVRNPEIPATTTSPTYLKWIERPSSSPLDSTLHKTHLHELMDGRIMNESCLMNQQKSIGETECITEIPQCFQKPEHQSIQEGSKSDKTVTTTGSFYSKTRSTSAGPSLFPFPMREIKLSQNEISTDKDNEGLPINIQDFGVDDLVKSFPDVDEEGDCQIHTSSVLDVIADNLVVKILVDLDKSLKMPLKDIACIEANINPLLVGLNFLSHLPLEDITLSDALEAIIVSMHKELPTILFSFKQVFATINKFVVLTPHLNEVATKLVSRISKAKNCIDEAQKKEATLKELIILLEKEIKHCEDGLSSLQEEKKICIAETIGYKKEYENVKKDKSKMLEDQRKARKELFEVDYRWSYLCCQFQLNRFAARNPS